MLFWRHGPFKRFYLEIENQFTDTAGHIFAFVILASCSTVKEKASGLKEIGKITKECPPKEERTLKHIFCKENK